MPVLQDISSTQSRYATHNGRRTQPLPQQRYKSLIKGTHHFQHISNPRVLGTGRVAAVSAQLLMECLHRELAATAASEVVPKAADGLYPLMYARRLPIFPKKQLCASGLSEPTNAFEDRATCMGCMGFCSCSAGTMLQILDEERPILPHHNSFRTPR